MRSCVLKIQMMMNEWNGADKSRKNQRKPHRIKVKLQQNNNTQFDYNHDGWLK